MYHAFRLESALCPLTIDDIKRMDNRAQIVMGSTRNFITFSASFLIKCWGGKQILNSNQKLLIEVHTFQVCLEGSVIASVVCGEIFGGWCSRGPEEDKHWGVEYEYEDAGRAGIGI
jgi:hypothetical protein